MSNRRKADTEKAAMRKWVRKLIQEELHKREMHVDCCEQHAHEEQEAWAIFGQPELDPALAAGFRKKQPHSLPDWGDEPFYPEGNDLEAPPLVNTNRRVRKSKM